MITEAMLALTKVTTCPNCGEARMADFYAYGSHKHRRRRKAWERGLVKGNPQPLPRPLRGESKGGDANTY